MKITEYKLKITVNGHNVEKILIGRHYLKKHGSYMNDQLILQLLMSLDGGRFPVDSVTGDMVYFAADVEYGSPPMIFRVIWLFEGEKMEILGVINAYRRKAAKKGKKK